VSKNYLGALYRRTAGGNGKKKAAIVVAHAMLRIAYYLLTRKEMYVDLGEDYFDKQKQVIYCSPFSSKTRKLRLYGYNYRSLLIYFKSINTNDQTLLSFLKR
jgi:hypothetical protein